jgi:hypothetical protein
MKPLLALLCGTTLLAAVAHAKNPPIIAGKRYAMAAPNPACRIELTVSAQTQNTATLRVDNKTFIGKLVRVPGNEGWTYVLHITASGKKSTLLCTFTGDDSCGAVRVAFNDPSVNKCSPVSEFFLETCTPGQK